MYKILEAIVGSQSYGLATANSDIDKLGIYLEPTKNVLSMYYNQDKATKTHTDPDWTYHEIAKFIKLAIAGNPSIVELLFAEKYEIRTLPANLILENKQKLLSTKAIASSYLGYAKAQIRKYHENTGRFNTERSARKNARHTLRLLIHASELLSTGVLTVRLTDDAAQMCHNISDLCIKDPQKFLDLTDVWITRVQRAETRSKLSEKPDIVGINAILTRIRHDYFWSVPDEP